MIGKAGNKRGGYFSDSKSMNDIVMAANHADDITGKE